MAPRARHLFDVALEKSWDDENGGMHYTFAPDGAILDKDRYYWVLSERRLNFFSASHTRRTLYAV